MLVLRGAPALSPFRIAKLQERLATLDAAVDVVEARWLHLVDVEHSPEPAALARLEALLRYGPREEAAPAGDPAGAAAADVADASGALVLVVPRAGTISPWSSRPTLAVSPATAIQPRAPSR